MTCRFLPILSTHPRNLSIASTDVANLSIFFNIFDIFFHWSDRFDTSARLREQLDAQFAESAELEARIKANLEGLGL